MSVTNTSKAAWILPRHSRQVLLEYSCEYDPNVFSTGDHPVTALEILDSQFGLP